MPRPPRSEWKRNQSLPDNVLQRFAKKFQLFAIPTRRYLRRRAWRYFRKIGKTDSPRYLHAALTFLPRYTDADTASDINLLDNWGLMHAFFGAARPLKANRGDGNSPWVSRLQTLRRLDSIPFGARTRRRSSI